jgi:hypothetical protein
MKYQNGGARTKCSLCKSEGTISSTCPWNPNAILSGKTKPSAHKITLGKKVLLKAKKGLEAMIKKLEKEGGKDDEIAMIQDIIDNGVPNKKSKASRKSQKAKQTKPSKPSKPSRKSQKKVVCKLNTNGRCTKHMSGAPDEECEYNESSKRCKRRKKSKVKTNPKPKTSSNQNVRDLSGEVEGSGGGGGAKEEEVEEVESKQAVPKQKSKPKHQLKPSISSSEAPDSVHDDREIDGLSEVSEPLDFVTINVNDIGAELPKIEITIGDDCHTFKLGLPYPDNSEHQYHNLYRYKSKKGKDEEDAGLILKGRCIIKGSGKGETLDVQLIEQ